MPWMSGWWWVFLLLAGAGLLWLGLRWLRRVLTPQWLPHPASVAWPLATWVNLPTTGGKRLQAQWLPANVRPARGLAVLLHGWGGNGSQLRPAALALWQQGWSVLLPDARCHGRSDDDTYSSLPRFAQDLDACLAWWQTQRSTSGTSTLPVVLLGHSLGAAAALLCASRRRDIQAVVAVSSFAHPEQVMKRWLAEYRIPFWPLGWLINRYIERVIGHRFDDIAPVATIARIEAPVLLVHGQQDDVVPLACALRLQASAPRATLLEVPGRHDGFDDAAALYKQVSTWLERVERA